MSPNLSPPFFVFSPYLGFRSVSGLGVTVETEQFRPMNSSYPTFFATGATVEAITLERGVKFNNADFFRWINRTINGTDQIRRNLLLIQFMGAAATKGGTAIGPNSQVMRIPGRAWILWGCIPTNYTAGDLDASSGDVSVQSLAIQPSAVTEISLGDPI